MKKCLDCKHMEASMLKTENVSEMFREILYLHCNRFNHMVVGYDRKDDAAYCYGFEQKGE